jgi:hypothetical protein
MMDIQCLRHFLEGETLASSPHLHSPHLAESAPADHFSLLNEAHQVGLAFPRRGLASGHERSGFEGGIGLADVDGA